MRKRKLKKYVLPSLYTFVIAIIVICCGIISKNVSGDVKLEYQDTNIIEEEVLPVFEENKWIRKPVDDNISLVNKFYSKDSDTKNQEDSLILYDNTYMPSKGYTYQSKESFKIYNTLDGTIKSIENDELLGNVITIDHGNNILSIYYSVDNISYSIGDNVNTGDIIGDSAINKIDPNNYSLIYEVSINGNLVDPNNFYTLDLNN